MRRWLWMVGVALLVALMPGLAGAAPRESMALAANERGNASGKFALELDGVIVGFVQEVDGGHAVADVVTEKLGGDWLVRKHIGNVKYEAIALKIDASLARPFYDWIKASLDGKHERKSGSIIYLDREGNEVERLSFTGGLLTEIGMPALDAASKDAAKMTIKIAPEYTRRSASEPKPVVVPATQKKWLPANFRLRIDGLEEPCARVNKIEAIVVKQRTLETGETWWDPSDLTFALENPLYQDGGMSGVNPLYEAQDQTLGASADGKGQERTGTLEYLAEDGRPIFTLSFGGLGVYRVTSGDQITATAYVQPQVSFQYSGQ
ncbi:MAG TPA: phage tail protein [Symbiobacteriaceae bacterium]|nr:phage tail protein [Symbiobacteriaceae bacterium]